MNAIDRKKAIREFKERKTPRGIYAVRCAASGQVWVGSSPNLEAKRNLTWLSLEQGGHRDAALQAAFNAHGRQAFTYEIVEKLKDDESPLTLHDTLKEKRLHWLAQLGAQAL